MGFLNSYISGRSALGDAGVWFGCGEATGVQTLPHTCILSISLHCHVYYFLDIVRLSRFPIPIITATFRARKGVRLTHQNQHNDVVVLQITGKISSEHITIVIRKIVVTIVTLIYYLPCAKNCTIRCCYPHFTDEESEGTEGMEE